MRNFYQLVVFCLAISIVSGQSSSSEEQEPVADSAVQIVERVSEHNRNSEEQIDNFASQLIGRLERFRDDCSNLPERSLIEKQLKNCALQTVERAYQFKEEEVNKSIEPYCVLISQFLECSSSLVTEIVSCGKNPELITIIGLAKGGCEYNTKNDLETLENELDVCFESEEAREEMEQCALEELNAIEEANDETGLASILETFCPVGKVIRKCSTVVLEKYCPQVFIELSGIYQSSRRLSGNTAAFDTCLTGSTSTEVKERSTDGSVC